MPRGNLMEYCPMQILSYEDIAEIVGCVNKQFKRKKVLDKLPDAARPAWDQVSGMILQALQDARLFGAQKAREWVTHIDSELNQWQANLGDDDYRLLRIVYMNYLDSLYGAILHHTLTHLPLSVMMPMAQLRMYRVSIWRYTMVKNTSDKDEPLKGALEQVIEMMYSGGGRFELDFEVRMLNE